MLVQKRYDCSIGFRVLVLMIAGLFFFSFNHSRIVSADTNSGALPLQPIIDSAREGDLITLAPGTYSGPVRLDKRVTINGNGKAILLHTAKDEQAAVQILADGVRLENLKIQQNNDGKQRLYALKRTGSP